ncbi:MAG: TerC family protein [Aquificaceae bacterium]
MLNTEWIVFGSFILTSLLLDLFVFQGKPHRISVKESLLLSIFWIIVGLSFGFYVFYARGSGSAIEYITGYMLEKSLSLDNIFVFILILSYFRVPEEYKHKVLFWGVFGAIVFRGIFIFLGIELVKRLEWVMYIFGVILIISAVKLLVTEEREFHPESTLLYKIAKKVLPMRPQMDKGRFFIREGRMVYATPIFLALLSVESSDIIFAIDSVPAIFAISKDPFVVYTSNIFAILGLRSLYFAANAILPMFHYLHYGLSFVLGFIGFKILISDFYHIPIFVSLLLVLSAVFLSIVASAISKR